MIFSYYKNAKDNTGTTITFDEVVKLIQGNTLEKQTKHLRQNLAPIVEKNTKNFNDFIADDIDVWNDFSEQLKKVKALKLKVENLTTKYNATNDEQIQQQLTQANANLQTAHTLLNDLTTPFTQAAIVLEDKKIKAKTAYDNYKQSNFPAPTFCGTFSPKRHINNITNYTGCIVIDIDKIQADLIPGYYNSICKDAHTMLAFISPSGAGIKVIFKTNNNDAANQYNVFAQVQNYFKEQWSLDIDPSGKDVSRLCFICHHSNCYVNANATIFNVDDSTNTEVSSSTTNTTPPSKGGAFIYIQEATTQSEKIQQPNTTATNSNGIELANQLNALNLIHNQICDWVNKRESLDEDINNNYIYLYAAQANRYGITLSECKSLVASEFAEGTEISIQKSIESAYKHNVSEFGTSYQNIEHFINSYNKKNEKNNQSNKKGNTQSNNQNNNSQLSTTQRGVQNKNFQAQDAETENEDIQFWYVTEKKDKDSGEIIEKYNIDYLRYLEFLQSKGFYRIIQGNSFEFVQVIGAAVEIIQPSTIIDYVREYAIERGLKRVLQMFIQGNKSYLAVDKFQFLERKNFNFCKDNLHTSHLFFFNGICKITKEAVEVLPYENFTQNIWKKQYIQHKLAYKQYDYLADENFEKYNEWSCVYAQFIFHVSCNAANVEDLVLDMETLKKRFLSFVTAIGYLLDGHKHLSVRKAVVGVDRQIGDSGLEKNGRTGKSIFAKALSFMKVVDNIDGKNYDPKYQFRYEAITPATQILCFNDMMKNHDIEQEFTIVADDYAVNKRNAGLTAYTYAESAKVYINTNYAPKGEGSSYRGRMHIIEFGDFFNDNNSPFIHFGHFLFSDWDEVQWNEFYSFMAWCLQKYKQLGLIDYPDGNLSKRKLLSMVDSELVDFLDEYHGPETNPQYNNLERNKWIDRKQLFAKWKIFCTENDLKATSPKWFLQVITQYARTKSFCFYLKKSGGKEEWWIGDMQPYDVNMTSVKPRIRHTNENTIIQGKLL